MQYPKINSIYKRDISQRNAPFIVGEWAEDCFDYLQFNPWEFSEKINGTNIRVMFDGENIVFGGKTDNAQIPSHLVNRMSELFLSLPRRKLLQEMFLKEKQKTDVVFYGEGFGHKIQGKSGTEYLGREVDFCLFDVKVGNWWLERKDVYGIGSKLGLKVPAVVGNGTLHEAIALVKEGFKSSYGIADAEGLVLRPLCELRDRSGQRVITKIKVRDFRITK